MIVNSHFYDKLKQMVKNKKSKPMLMLLKHDFRSLEYDPLIQYKFHRTMSLFWACMIFAVPFVKQLHPNAADLFIIEASLYSNFATEFSGMSSALAAKKDQTQGTEIKHVLTTVFDVD